MNLVPAGELVQRAVMFAILRLAGVEPAIAGDLELAASVSPSFRCDGIREIVPRGFSWHENQQSTDLPVDRLLAGEVFADAPALIHQFVGLCGGIGPYCLPFFLIEIQRLVRRIIRRGAGSTEHKQD